MKKNIKMLLSGAIVLTLVVVVFIINTDKEKIEEDFKFNLLNINLSKLVEEERYMFSADLSNVTDIFDALDSEANRMFDECNSKLINL